MSIINNPNAPSGTSVSQQSWTVEDLTVTDDLTISASGTLNTHTVPSGTDTFAMLAATQVLAAKTLTAPVINGAVTTTGLTLPNFNLGSSDVTLQRTANTFAVVTNSVTGIRSVSGQVKLGAGAGATWSNRVWSDFSLEVSTGVGFVSNIVLWEETMGGEFIFATNPDTAPTWHIDNDTAGAEGAIGLAFRIFRQPTIADSGLLYLVFKPAASDFYTPDLAGTTAVKRLSISGGIATAVATWTNVTHTGIVLSGALDANSQTISNVVSITGATGINLMPSGDTDDYITFTTVANVPTITATGAAYLAIASILYPQADIYIGANIIGVVGTINFNTQNADASVIIFGARDSGVGIVEVGRILGAADPEFKLGNNGNALRASYAGSLGFFGTAPQAKIVDARIDDVINSGDATTDGVIDAIRDAMITYGLIAAA